MGQMNILALSKRLAIVGMFFSVAVAMYMACYYTGRDVFLSLSIVSLVSLFAYQYELSPKALLFELLPICKKDAAVLVRWVSKNNASWLRFCANGTIWCVKCTAKILSRYYRPIFVFFAGLYGAQYFAESAEFGNGASLWIIVCGCYLIFTNLGKRAEGEMSAYSVFNKNFQNLMGQLTGEQLDRELRHNDRRDD